MEFTYFGEKKGQLNLLKTGILTNEMPIKKMCIYLEPNFIYT